MAGKRRSHPLIKREDKLHIYRRSFFEDITFTEEQTNMMARYKRTIGFLSLNGSIQMTSKMLQQDFDISEGHAYQIIRDAMKLYGDVTETDTNGKRYILFENFMLTFNLARKANNFGEMNRSLENAGKLYDLFSKPKTEIDINVFMALPKSTYSTNPKTLKIQAEQEKRESEADYFSEFEEI